MVLFKRLGLNQNFVRPTVKNLCRSLYLMKSLSAEVSLLKRGPAQIFSSKFCKIFKSTFFIWHFRATSYDSSSQLLCLNHNIGFKMTSVEATLLTLLPALKMFLSVEITLEATIQNNFLSLRNFQEKYLWLR